MMWIVIGDLNVLPNNLIAIAIPWSFFWGGFISDFKCKYISIIL